MDMILIYASVMVGLIMPISYLASIISERMRNRGRSSAQLAWFHPPVTVTVPTPPPIPREVQEEIDQTPEWWDRQLHKLLAQTDTPLVHEIEYAIENTFAGREVTYRTRALQEYVDCICGECMAMRRQFS